MEKSPNDAYFEQSVISQIGRLSEEELVQRISDCSMIIDKLTADPVWRVVVKDATTWVNRLDSNWQEIEDDRQRNYARILKFAYMHLKELPNKYKVDLENAKKALDIRRNTDKSVQRDYDLETIKE